ncbi:MAG TPA: hypothetical protein VMM37_07495, partial [Bacteroidota bacterium]|nr:hypothetical protein [Bacteroidota bacterium]
MAQRSPEKAKSAKATASRLYVVGESPMVEEYADLFASKGYEVGVAWSTPPGEKPKLNPALVKATPTVPANVALAVELTNTDRGRKRENIEKLDKALPPTAP